MSSRRGWRRWRIPLGVGVALVAAGVALALPAPRPAVPASAPPPAGPLRLAQAWPTALVTTLPSTIADGYAYQPFVVLDSTTSIGVATSPDFTSTRLVALIGSSERDLRILSGDQPATVAAVTVSGGEVYWIETGQDDAGVRHTALWRVNLRSGPIQRLVNDFSDVLYYDSGYDLQVVDGVVHWAAAVTDGSGGEIHSVSANGGPESVRRLGRLYALTAWPWATTSGNGQPGPVDLVNLVSGEHRSVAGGPDEILNCTPTWCRVTTLINRGQSLVVDIEHLDGSARQRIGDTALTPVNTDVALRDRFEVLAEAASANAIGSAQRLWLYELATRRSVLLDDAATDGLGGRDNYLWWSTGDNETLTWHLLDLRTLP